MLFFPIDVREVSIDYKYYILLLGRLETKEKACCFISDIEPYFDIEIPDISNVKQLNIVSDEPFLSRYRYECMQRKNFMYYGDAINVVRVYFNNLFDRKRWLKIFGRLDYNIYSNDETSYYRKFARESKLRLSDWIQIDKHYNNEHCHRYIKNIKNIYCIHYKDIKNADNVDRDIPLLELSFDIETHSDIDGIVPIPNNAEDKIFMLSCSLNWLNSDKEINNYVLTTLCYPDEFITLFPHIKLIYCNNEVKLIRLFIEILRKCQPDIIMDFNGSLYDWDFILSRIATYQLESLLTSISPCNDEFINKQWKRETQIKIEANTNKIATFLNIPGIVCIDMRTDCMKAMPTSEKSNLNYFLSIYDLPSKVDMSVVIMRKLFKAISSYPKWDYTALNEYYDEWKILVEYSIIDSISCKRLSQARNTFMKLKESANLAYISLYDEIYYAGGMKVRNLIMANGSNEFVFPCVKKYSTNKKKYPGAYVVTPETRLHTDNPVLMMDFSSLYPNITITYNLSQECVFTDEYQLEKYDKNKYELHEISFTYVDDVEECKGWVLRYINESDMGLCPRTLLSLYNKRMDVKTQLKKIEQDKSTSADIKRKNLDALQYALKIYMNTFYGESGNSISPFYIPLVAGGITTIGRFLLTTCIGKIKEMDNTIIYGDTDSIYYSKKLDASISWIDKINSSIDMGNADLKILNNYIKLLTKQKFLKLEFEGVLFPCFMIERKNYVGVKYTRHTDNVNTSLLNDVDKFITADNLLIKGLEVKKRGIDAYTKFIINSILMKMFSIESVGKSIIDIIKSSYITLSQSTLDKKLYIKTAQYRKSEHNTFITTFVNRLCLENAPIIPQLNERFNYIVVVSNNRNDKISDKMRFISGDDIPDSHKLDTNYYINSANKIIYKFIKNLPEYVNKSEGSMLKEINSWGMQNLDIQTYNKTRARLFIPDLLHCKTVNNVYDVIYQYAICESKKKTNECMKPLAPQETYESEYRKYLNLIYGTIHDMIYALNISYNENIHHCNTLLKTNLIDVIYYCQLLNSLKYKIHSQFNIRNTNSIINGRERIYSRLEENIME